MSLGFVALSMAVAVAYVTPATGYEVSVYAGTHPLVWVGLATALLASIACAVLASDRQLRTLSLVLGGTSIAMFVAMPIIRGYWFYASADSLSHLGWIKDIRAGVLDPFELFYPGTHLVTILVSELAGFRLERSAMLVVVVFTVIYLAFVALSMRGITSSGFGQAVGAIAGFMLLPINTIVVKLAVHPISQAVFFFALVLYLFLKFARDRSASLVGLFTNTGLLLALSTAGVVLYHPQQAAVILVLFGTITAAQLMVKLRRSGGAMAGSRFLFSQTVFLTVVFVLWALIHQGLTGQIATILTTVLEFVRGTGGGQAGAVVSQRSGSLTAVGSGVVPIFLKLFLVSAIFAVLAGFAILSSLFARFDDETVDADTVLRYVSYGFLVLAPFAFMHFVGRLSKLYFRYHASMMVIITLLGGFSLYYFAGRRLSSATESLGIFDPFDPFSRSSGADRTRISDSNRAIIGLALAYLLLISLITVYPSPFIYQPSMQVTEPQQDGYAWAFDHQDPGASVSTTGVPSWRYRHAISGTTGTDWGPPNVPPPEYDHNLAGYLRDTSADGERYLVVTSYDRTRAVEVYDGLHFTRADFEELKRAPGTNRVYANGETTTYQRPQSSNG